jgi:eukaryotic-like serine/threonine-protein kinase
LGPYEVLALIGKGGMGEVYRARDTKLKRDVALKVLPENLARNPERMARFQREAEVLASLNHPNIAAIYGVEDGALVMELVEGQSPHGPLPFDEAWPIASQIAAALEYAHDRGIVHRDLKPTNLKITPEGIVKLLDFGLAKAMSNEREASAEVGGENSPTVTMGATEAGVILGTAAYMAPEQAKGKSVDKRADIWAFGVVLYELLTGQRLFKGDNAPETMAHVLTLDPDLNRVSPRTRKLLLRCLEKDPKKRLRDIGDAAQLLDDSPSSEAPSESRFGWVAWGVSGLLLVMLAGLAFVHFRERAPQERSLRFQIPLPEKIPTADQRISPDGRYLAFAESGASALLWVRPLNSLAAQPLAGTEGATYPFWSPDSKSIGFFARGKLKRIEITGGPPLTLADVSAGRGGTWGSDGTNEGVILFTPTRNSPIMRIPAGGGTVSSATKIRAGEVSHRLPWFLPEGGKFLYAATQEENSDHTIIHFGNLSTAEDRVVGEADSGAIYSQGFLLFLRQETLMAQPFDAQRGMVTGAAAPLEPQIHRRLTSAYADFSASSNGLLAFRIGAVGGSSQLTWVDRSGKQLGKLGEPGNISDFQFSPDRKSVAAALLPSGTGNGDIWIYDAVRGPRTRFTFDPILDENPVWSPDGRSIVYSSRRKHYTDLYRKSSDGTGAEELLYSDNLDKTPTSWSEDGKFLLFHAPGSGPGLDVWVLPLSPERPGSPLKPFPFAQSPVNEMTAQFSPDGRWIAYVSDESQRFEVYVARFPGAGGKRRISVAGGIMPRWRRDGTEIFYVGLDARVMAAAMTVKGDALDVGEVRPLFGPLELLTIANYRYDASADGQRFLIIPPQGSAEGVTVVQNWVAGLKK